MIYYVTKDQLDVSMNSQLCVAKQSAEQFKRQYPNSTITIQAFDSKVPGGGGPLKYTLLVTLEINPNWSTSIRFKKVRHV